MHAYTGCPVTVLRSAIHITSKSTSLQFTELRTVTGHPVIQLILCYSNPCGAPLRAIRRARNVRKYFFRHSVPSVGNLCIILNFCFFSLLPVEEVEFKNPVNNDGNTPLHHAARYGRLDVCRYIIGNGNIKYPANNAGRTPKDLANDNNHVEVSQLFE